MTKVNFKLAFKTLQAMPGDDLETVKDKYALLTASPDFIEKFEKKDEEAQKIVDAYNALQLLLIPYDRLPELERTSLLESLNETPEHELKELLDLYPHRGMKFYWDSTGYDHLWAYLTPKGPSFTSLLTGCFGMFTPISGAFCMQKPNEDANELDRESPKP